MIEECGVPGKHGSWLLVAAHCNAWCHSDLSNNSVEFDPGNLSLISLLDFPKGYTWRWSNTMSDFISQPHTLLNLAYKSKQCCMAKKTRTHQGSTKCGVAKWNLTVWSYINSISAVFGCRLIFTDITNAAWSLMLAPLAWTLMQRARSA